MREPLTRVHLKIPTTKLGSAEPGDLDVAARDRPVERPDAVLCDII